MLLINPHNPTGKILTVDEMRQIVKFCVENNLVLIASEVLQDTIHTTDKFVSFHKIIDSMEHPYNELELFTFHTASKSNLFIGSARAGYLQVANLDQEVQTQLYKHVSLDICSSTPGQIMLDLSLNYPHISEKIFENKEDFVNKYYESMKLSKNTYKILIENFSIEFSKSPLFNFTKPKSGFTFFIELNSKLKYLDNISIGEVYSQMLQEELNLLSTPGICKFFI